MASDRRAIVVTGATGKQGGALIEALLAKPSQPFNIYAVTRNKESNSAKSLASKPNVHVVEGHFDDPAAIFAQVEKPWGLFSVTTPELGKKNAAVIEEQQGKAMNTAAMAAGVQHVVYTSVDRGVDENIETPVPHFRSKKHIEDDLKTQAASKGAVWTILRTVAFMDNMTNDFMGRVFVAMWRQVGMDTPLQLLSSKDIGRVVAEIFLHAEDDEYRNKAISLAGDSITPRQAEQAFKDATGQEMPAAFGIFGYLAKAMMSDELGTMFRWFKEVGFAADVGGLKRKYPFLKDFKSWVETESAWRKR